MSASAMPTYSKSENNSTFLLAVKELLPQYKIQSDASLEKRIGRERLCDAADDMAGFIAAGCKRELTKNERFAISCQLLKCVEDFVKEDLSLPVTLKTLIDGVSALQHAADKSFPSYARNQMLLYLIRHEKSAL